MFIKKLVAYIPCQILYYIGDLVSKIMNKIPEGDIYQELVYNLYDVYNGLMLWSVWWNDFGGLHVWKTPEKEIV